MGAGFDNIDTKALSSAGVYYCNTPESVSIPTADSASVLILTTLKSTIQGDRNVRRGKWSEGVPKGMNPKGAVLGILGMGSIGQITARQMQAFGMKVIYHNRHELPKESECAPSPAGECVVLRPGSSTIAEAAGATYVASLPDFLSQCDVVSVHIPLSDATRHFISTEQFAHFKDGARLVNTARGPVVDEEALVQALKSGKVSAAGLDVFENEPKVHPYLLEADNVLLQPHTGVGPPLRETTLLFLTDAHLVSEQHGRDTRRDNARDAWQPCIIPLCAEWGSASECRQPARQGGTAYAQAEIAGTGVMGFRVNVDCVAARRLTCDRT